MVRIKKQTETVSDTLQDHSILVGFHYSSILVNDKDPEPIN